MTKMSKYKKISYFALTAVLLLLAAGSITTLTADASDILHKEGTLTINKDRFILQSGKEKLILSMLPAAGMDSLDFHPAEGDTLSVQGVMNKNVLLVSQVDWKGRQIALRDSLNQPLWNAQSSYVNEPKGCIGCQLCKVFCPNDAITMVKQDGYLKAVIDQTKCTGCNVCITGNNVKFMGCPTKSITK